MGKTRLCAELFAYIEQRPGLVRWRQGRCLPYGEGIAFWALGEIVKAECGILESDSPKWRWPSSTRPSRSTSQIGPGSARLVPLLGVDASWRASRICSPPGGRFRVDRRARPLGPDGRRFALGGRAAARLLGIPGRLAAGVPLLMLSTARPEFYEPRPPGRPVCAPLRRSTSRRSRTPIRQRWSRAVKAHGAAGADTALPARPGGWEPAVCGGVRRLFRDRDLLAGPLEAGRSPNSVQALIAARLDTLWPERKSLLQDAARDRQGVLGRGARRDGRARSRARSSMALHELARKELVRPAGQLDAGRGGVRLLAPAGTRRLLPADPPRQPRGPAPRRCCLDRGPGGRARRETSATCSPTTTSRRWSWLAPSARSRTSRSWRLRRAAISHWPGSGPCPSTWPAPRPASLVRSQLTPAGCPERAGLLEHWAQAARQQGRLPEARAALEEALALHTGQREAVAAARTLTTLSNVLRTAGDPRHRDLIAEALTLLAAEAPGPELVTAYAELAGNRAVDSDYPEAITAAERALQLAADLGLPESARALGYRGIAPGCSGGGTGPDRHAPRTRARRRAGTGPRRRCPAQQSRARHVGA